MESYSSKLVRSHEYYGREIRLVGAMHAGEVDQSLLSHSNFDNIGFSLLRRLYMRPCIEPVLHSYCDLFDPYNINLEMLDGLNGALRGAKPSRREGDLYARDRKTLKHCPVGLGQDIISNLNTICAPFRGDALTYAASLYHNIIYAHYYADGNGRLARAVCSLSLYKLGVLEDPFIPMGISSYMNISSAPAQPNGLCDEINIERTVQTIKSIVEPCVNPQTREIIAQATGCPDAPDR
jgi:hypothetical protein